MGRHIVVGHVPAQDVRRLLSERQKILGLADPGMSMGSPGMEHPDPTRDLAYAVMAFGIDGAKVFARYEP